MELKTKELTTCALFAALIAVGAFIKIDIPLPIYTMHFTLQWLFVLLAGFLLGLLQNGFLDVAAEGRQGLGHFGFVYLLIGLMGVPVFASGGGPAYILRPTFGFLLGFLFAAFAIGWITERMKANKSYQYGIAGIVGLVIYYGFGVLYFYFINNFVNYTPVSLGAVVVDYCLITILPDALLVVAATLMAKKIRAVFKYISTSKLVA